MAFILMRLFVCLFDASREYFPCHNFFTGFSKGDVSRSVSTLFCKICFSYLFSLLYDLLSRDTSAGATDLKTSPRSKSAFSKPKCKRYTCILSFMASVEPNLEPRSNGHLVSFHCPFMLHNTFLSKSSIEFKP